MSDPLFGEPADPPFGVPEHDRAAEGAGAEGAAAGAEPAEKPAAELRKVADVAWVSTEKVGEKALADPGSPPAVPRSFTNLDPECIDGPIWQWEHRSGFKNYSQLESDRIEKYYQQGCWMMRMKSGIGKKAKPREIYFADMAQFDPASGSERKIRRVPEPTKLNKIVFHASAMVNAFFAGDLNWWKPKTRADFDKIRNGVKTVGVQEVFSMHNEDSRWYAITETWTFGVLSLLMIVLNSIYIWLDADYNPGVVFSDTPWYFIFADNVFAIWFTVEMIFRSMAYSKFRYILQDYWLLLDVALVALMIFETWLLQLGLLIVYGESNTSQVNRFSILRVMRLLKLVRISRLFKVFPQLFVMVKGMALAMKSLFYTMQLLFVLLFVFGVALKNLNDMSNELDGMGFDSVSSSMWRLWIDGTLMDNVGDLLNGALEARFIYAAIVMLFIFVSNLTMLNMLIGVLCEVITRVTQEQKDQAELEELEEGLQELLETYDIEDDRSLGRKEFSALMINPDFRVILSSHSIDIADLVRLEGVLYEDQPTLSFDVFLEKVFQLRGGNTATVNDMAELRSFLNKRFNSIEAHFPQCEDMVGLDSQEHEPERSQVVELPGRVASDADLCAEAASQADQSTKVARGSSQQALLSAVEELKAEHVGLKAEVAMMRGSIAEIHQMLSALTDAAARGTTPKPGVEAGGPDQPLLR